MPLPGDVERRSESGSNRHSRLKGLLNVAATHVADGARCQNSNEWGSAQSPARGWCDVLGSKTPFPHVAKGFFLACPLPRRVRLERRDPGWMRIVPSPRDVGADHRCCDPRGSVTIARVLLFYRLLPHV